LAEEGSKFLLDTFNMQMRQSEQKLIEILIELFGMTSCDKIASCYEYSKISAVMGLWSSPLPEMRLMGKDLERPHSKKLVKAICETVELNETQLKKELYSLLHYVNENRCFVSSDHILNLHLDGEWAKCKGKVAPEVVEEGLHSRSDIMGDCAVYMAAYNIETAGVRDLLIRMLRTSSSETVVERAGRVLAACEEKNLAMYAEARLMDDAIPSYTCLYDYLPKRVEDPDAENWLMIIQHGLMENRYMVSATLNYILSVEQDNIPQRIKDTLISMVEKSFVEWNQKQVKCLHCKEETIVKEDGFCPKCGIGANLPTKNFIEVLTKYQRLTMEQYISLCRHPVSEVRDIARQELKRIWMMDPKKLKAVIAGFEECAYGENIFSLILQLPSDVTSVYKPNLQRLGMTTNDKMLVEWIRRLRHLDWVSASERKEMLKKCLTSESDRVRDGAMVCWLNEEGTF